MPKEGDRVKVKTKKGIEEGILMPSSKEGIVMLKLDNGYNIGFQKKEIKEIKVVKGKKSSVKSKKPSKTKPTKKKGLKTISILHCGGTIASKVDYETGAVKAKFKPEELREMFPELNKVANIDSKLVANMFSEDMRFEHFNLMAKEIEASIKKGSEGIILTQGTDFLHYTAAALAFILEGLSIPVLVVGSQRSSDRGSSDAAFNLSCAVKFITNSDFGEVGVCMHDSSEDKRCVILPACKTRKLHTSRRDAFKAVNSEPWAFVDDKITFVKKGYIKRNKEKLSLKLFDTKLKVGILKAHPAMWAEEVKNYANFDGVVLEGGGISGNFPINDVDKSTKEHSKILDELKKLTIPLVATSQCIFGRVNMNVYSTGRKMQEIGILGNLLDITTETAFIKLAWLLSNYPKEVKALWSKNFRGEFSKKGKYEKEFLKK